MTAGIYARISLDRRDGEGVARQLADCHELAAARGWTDVAEYVDNDISAFRRKKRPEYDRLIADLHAGRLDAVVAYHPDRLYRQLADLETFVAAIRHAGATVATVKAGDVDVSTASGQMIAEILASVSKHEAARIGERVSRSKKERAAAGRPAGGGRRPFGYTADRTALVDREAQALRETAAAILAGASWGQQVARLNDAGIRNVSGQHWSVVTLRRTLTSPHIAGLRTYHGRIVGEATWPPILDRVTWEELRIEADSRARVRAPSSTNLLTGLIVCGHCGKPLWSNATRSGAKAYRCSPTPSTKGRGCGKISISARVAETHVAGTVAGWLQRPAFVAALDAYLAYDDHNLADVRSELDEVERREIRSARQWAEGTMTDAVYDDVSALLAERRRELEAKLAGVGPRSGPPVSAADLAAAWDRMVDDVAWRREVIRLVARTPIVVGPGRGENDRRLPVEDRIRLHPAWE